MTAAKMNSFIGNISKEYVPANAYIMDEIYAMWDGIENNGWGQHIDYTNVWCDLIDGFYMQTGGDSIGDFSKGYADHSIAFWNGVGDPKTQTGIRYYSKAVALRKMLNSGKFTIEVSHCPQIAAMSTYSYNNVAQGLFGLQSSHSALSFVACGKIHVYNSLFVGTDSKNIYATPMYDKAKETRTIVFDVDSQKVYVYLNGSLDVEAELNQSINWNGSESNPLMMLNTCIGIRINNPMNSWNASAQAMSDVYSIRIYSRALSPEEINYNYSIDKERFNLP